MTSSSEIERRTSSGYLWIVVGLALIIAGLAALLQLPHMGPAALFVAVPLLIAGPFVMSGLYMLQPNEGAILLLFGAYKGTDRTEGLRWANPFFKKQKMSACARATSTATRLKVNDKRGNPIEIAAAIVWRVQRHRAGRRSTSTTSRTTCASRPRPRCATWPRNYAYDEGEDLHRARSRCAPARTRSRPSLKPRADGALRPGGIVVEDAKLTHLAYAPEIAQVMLRRQQAEAIIAARSKIVHGAVSMVEMALTGCRNATSSTSTTSARRRW